MNKYPDIERLGNEDNKDILIFNEDMIFVEEKVDGGNGSMWLEQDGVHFGTRNRDLTTDGDKKTFQGRQIWLREHLAKLEEKEIKLNPEYIYYFEWMEKHTIAYTNSPMIIGLDIRLRHANNQEGLGLFLAREGKENEFKRIEIELTPLIWKGTAGELKKLEIEKLIPKSKYYDGMAEGIVIKNYGRKNPHGNHQLFAKIVRQEFKEDNKAVFGSVKNKSSDTAKIIEEYCTEARVRKAVLKFVNEYNEKLELKLMAKVPSYIIKDILKEEYASIYDKYAFIDFKEMRQRVPKICLRVINQMMMENVK